MAHLFNKTKNIEIADDVEIASSTYSRMKGLLGRDSLHAGSALWITLGGSIHTFFMRFPIDVIFVDKKLEVTSVHVNVKPWRLLFSNLKTRSVFELNAGSLHPDTVEKGDQLYVGG